jgi:hypothetical protein
MERKCGPVDPLERIAVRGGSAGLPRHADKDRRATPFIPACATVNSVCEPQFWFDRLIRTAIANSIACNCPIRFQIGGDDNVFHRPLISFWRGSPARRPHTCLGSDNESGDGCEKEGCKTRKLLKTAATVVIALAPVVAAGTAEAHSVGFGGGGFHAGGFHGGGFGRGGSRDRGFRGDRFRFGGIFGGFYPGYYGGYYPGYYGYGSCYLTVYGTTYCY